jgi:1-acyl-sn-glycerol-3-phosphate acyltransferase
MIHYWKNLHQDFSVFWMRLLAWLITHLSYRLRVEGVENIPSKGAAVLVCNHVSFVDWMLVSAAVPRPIRFIMDHNYAKGFFIRFLLKQGGVILIAPAHESVAIMESAFVQIAKELSLGQLVCVFPEGKITKTGEMNPFKDGIMRILKQSPVPVIPIALCGMWGSIFSRFGGKAFSTMPRPFRKVYLKVGQPMAPHEANLETMYAEVNKLRGKLL